MRNLAQALLITFGCFAAAGVNASDSEETFAEVVISSDEQNTPVVQEPSFNADEDESKTKI